MIRVTIRQAAKRRGIRTPRELAQAVGVKDAVAWRWWQWATQGDPIPTLESLDKICAAFECELYELVAVSASKNGKKKQRTNGK